MQRFHAGSCTSAVNNNAIGGIQARDTSRAESPAVAPNFSLNSRRSSQLSPYKLRCDKEQLNSRLGPPDFHPQSPNCPEETLIRGYVQSGYRETVEGLEESREISLSQAQAFTKPVIVKCKEAIRKCHRAINESRAQKRKAGQVYGVPLSGMLLTKSGIFPELRPCGEDFRKKWIERLGYVEYFRENETILYPFCVILSQQGLIFEKKDCEENDEEMKDLAALVVQQDVGQVDGVTKLTSRLKDACFMSSISRLQRRLNKVVLRDAFDEDLTRLGRTVTAAGGTILVLFKKCLCHSYLWD